jgi:radical SAM protein with 4Fe4S-binding SPASM domain
MIIAERPSYLQFYPTLTCNQRCAFCFNRTLNPLPDVTLPVFNTLLSVMVTAGIPCLDILGGEPTLHPDLLKMITLLMSHPLKVNMSSNGSKVRLLRLLSKTYPRDKLRIGLSINEEKVSPDLEDYILDHRPVLKSLFWSPGIIPESGRPFLGLPGSEYYLIYPDVLDKDDLTRGWPFERYYRTLNAVKNEYRGVDGVFCEGFISDRSTCPGLASVRCPAGTTKLSVLPDGTVYPCYLLFGFSQFALGNLMKDDFETIWHHPLLDTFRRFENNRCPKKGCACHPLCHGGCPAIRYHFYGDLEGPDPRCLTGEVS